MFQHNSKCDAALGIFGDGKLSFRQATSYMQFPHIYIFY